MRPVIDSVWRKSSRSSANNCCVEIARYSDDSGHPAGVAIRDSKNPGPRLVFSAEEFADLIHDIKAGRLAR
jgi:hypothetical protein